MDNTQNATVVSGSAMGSAENTAVKDLKANKQEQKAELHVAKNVDTKVSDAEAQRKTAVWMEIFYAAMMLMVGFIIMIYGAIWLADPSSMGTAGYSNLDVNSYFAMAIVGAGLVFWGIIAVVIAANMQIKNRVDHKVSNAWGILNWFTLNPFSWSLIRQSNGYVSKKAKAKAAKKAAAANSQDSIDEAADVQQEQQQASAEIN